MAISGDVKSLTEDIEASYETRTAAVSDLLKETHQTLENFKREREQMASDLQRSLASNRSDRIRQVQEMRVETSKDLHEVTQKISGFLAVAETERKQDFAHLIEEIRGVVARIEQDTARTLADFRSQHREMAEALKVELTSFQSNLSREVSAVVAEFSRDHQQAHTNWENMTRVMAAKRSGKQATSAQARKNPPTSVEV